MTHPSESAIEFVNVSYRLADNRELLSSLNLNIRRGEILMLLGRSGSGKTTTLKLINRLLEPSTGEVLVNGTPTVGWDPIKLRRSIGYAIQDVGLFPHYSVRRNVGLIPALEGWRRNKITSRVREVLELVGLEPDKYLDRYPDQLSGGQRQRIGLARALAADPPILLMDEPFGALDPLSRVELQTEFRKLQQRLAKTVVFVTHDVGEALLLGTRIALMENGKLIGIHTPTEFLSAPDDSAQAYVEAYRAGHRFLGEANQ